jgi:hypothetical protein
MLGILGVLLLICAVIFGLVGVLSFAMGHIALAVVCAVVVWICWWGAGGMSDLSNHY